MVATLAGISGLAFSVRHARGYDAAREDALLASIRGLKTATGCSRLRPWTNQVWRAGFCPIAESNALFLKRELWDALQGMDEGSTPPGAGLSISIYSIAPLHCRIAACHSSGRGGRFINCTAASQPTVPPNTGELAKMAGQYAQIRRRPYQIPVPAIARVCRLAVAGGPAAFCPRRS